MKRVCKLSTITFILALLIGVFAAPSATYAKYVNPTDPLCKPLTTTCGYYAAYVLKINKQYDRSITLHSNANDERVKAVKYVNPGKLSSSDISKRLFSIPAIGAKYQKKKSLSKASFAHPKHIFAGKGKVNTCYDLMWKTGKGKTKKIADVTFLCTKKPKSYYGYVITKMTVKKIAEI